MGRISKRDRELLTALNGETIKEPSGTARPVEPVVVEPVATEPVATAETQSAVSLMKPKRTLTEKQLANLKAGREKRATARASLGASVAKLEPIAEEPQPEKPKPKPKPKRQVVMESGESELDDDELVHAVEPTARRVASRTYEVIHRHEHVNYDAGKHRPNPLKASRATVFDGDTSSFFA